MHQLSTRVYSLFFAILACSVAASGVHAAPLRQDPNNPRYFTDGVRTIYLTGSHTWPTLLDRGTINDQPFDFNQYLDLVEAYNHNFLRLWNTHVSVYTRYGPEPLYSGPMPWLRTGPDNAGDGAPAFDLTQFNPEHFARIRERVAAAAARGIYVSVMLFGGRNELIEWYGNPLNIANNVNGIDGDPDGDWFGDIQRLPLPDGVEAIQKAYVQQVIDTLNDFDNIIWEISNESMADSASWQYDLVQYVRDYEAGRIDGVPRNEHPVGMTGFWDVDNAPLFNSAADWISVGTVDFNSFEEPYIVNPPATDGNKVSILDSDHLFYETAFGNPWVTRQWVWKSFLRGHNPILMENYPVDSTGGGAMVTTHDEAYIAARKAMGDTLRYANRINLTGAVPRADLGTGYVLAAGSEYLIYQPSLEPFLMDLAAGNYDVEWFDTISGETSFTSISSDGVTAFAPPFAEAVLYLRNASSF